jgi:hypothetical protein
MKNIRVLLLLALGATACVAQKRLVLIDQDGSGPGGSNQMAMLALLQSPQVEVLGITMVTGNAWRDEETLHTLRMLELTATLRSPSLVVRSSRSSARNKRRALPPRSSAKSPGSVLGARVPQRWKSTAPASRRSRPAI